MQIYYEFAFAAFLPTVKIVLILIQLSIALLILSSLVSFSNLMRKSCNPSCMCINYTILRNSVRTLQLTNANYSECHDVHQINGSSLVIILCNN